MDILRPVYGYQGDGDIIDADGRVVVNTDQRRLIHPSDYPAILEVIQYANTVLDKNNVINVLSDIASHPPIWGPANEESLEIPWNLPTMEPLDTTYRKRVEDEFTVPEGVVTDVPCRGVNCNSRTFRIKQWHSRAADEEMTVRYTCTACGKVAIEN